MSDRAKSWAEFISLCQSDYAKDHLDTFFEFFLTPEERDMLASRVLITKELLEAKKPQRQIAKETGVSIAKITRGSNELKRADAHFIAFLKQALLSE